MTSPLALLGRTDKAVLAGGDGIAFAPTRELPGPGFWHGAVVLGRDVSPLFAVTILDADGRELVPAVASQQWTPAALVTEYRFVQGITATEVRTTHPGGVFVSEWRFSAPQPMQLHVVAWTAIDAAALRDGSLKYEGALSFGRAVDDGEVECALAVIGGATSWAAFSSEGALDAPQWRLTPFLEHWRPEGLPRTIRANDSLRGRCFVAVHRAVSVLRDGGSAALAMRAVPREPFLRPPGAVVSAAPSSGTFESASVRNWGKRFAAVPQLAASDPYIERTYWYRWYGAWMLRIDKGTGAFADGGAGAHVRSIGVADAMLAPAIVRDLRWHADIGWARSALTPFFDHQRSDGSFPRIVRATGPGRGSAPPTIDWGGALRAYAEREPDMERVRRAWLACERYARWLFGSHDAQSVGLIEVRAPYETDGAASPRFSAIGTSLTASRVVHAVDASAYAYTLCRTLDALAARVREDGSVWAERAESVGRAMRDRLWDDDLGFFCDADAVTGRRIGVRSAAGFTAFAPGLASPAAVDRMVASLLDVRRFWTPFPVPSLAADEPAFDAMGEWDGVREELPRNGRMWPADTALVVDALAAAEPGGDGRLRRAAAQLLRRLVRAHFPDGDLHAPSAQEHLNPITGHASVYRGIDEYFGAWLVDLIVRHAAGIHIEDGALRLDPLPLGLDALTLTGLIVRGRTIDVSVTDDRVVATVDGVRHETAIGVGIVIQDDCSCPLAPPSPVP